MAATTLFSAPISPYKHTSPTHHLPSLASWQPTHPHPAPRSPLILLRASSSTPTVDKQEEEDEAKENNSSTAPTDQSQSTNSIPIGGCRACGKAEIERGCNGEGRIQGGIATVPGFGWWPIKAYRPCPGFVATGGRYRRQGQSMDEVAGFGSVQRKPAAAGVTAIATDGGEAQSSEKKEGPRKFKR